jgi:hypothetical protein
VSNTRRSPQRQAFSVEGCVNFWGFEEVWVSRAGGRSRVARARALGSGDDHAVVDADRRLGRIAGIGQVEGGGDYRLVVEHQGRRWPGVRVLAESFGDAGGP